MRVDAQAVSKVIRTADPEMIKTVVPELGFGRYEITVTGLPPYDFTRVYVINGPNETFAARQGLDRFVEEFRRGTH